jgi:hypothetical protein
MNGVWADNLPASLAAMMLGQEGTANLAGFSILDAYTQSDERKRSDKFYRLSA